MLPKVSPPSLLFRHMASFIVDTSQVLSATTGTDSVWIQSGGAASSTVYGLDGNDTITMEGTNNLTGGPGVVIRLAGGDDTVTIQSANFSAGNLKLYAGTGNDTITISGGTVQVLNTNEGNDFVIGTGGATFTAANLAAGSDTVNLSGTVDSLGMGNGHDVLSASVLTTLTGGSITLGDGNDTLSIGSLSGASALTLFGDNASNYNADLIDLATETGLNGFTLKARGGSDTINLSGIAASSIIQGNDGHDSITISGDGGHSFAGTEIGGGKGNDTILIELSGGLLVSGDLFGGAGHDSIYLNDALGVSGATDGTAFNIHGGAGKDTIVFNAQMSGIAAGYDAEYNTLVLSSLSESNLSAMDLVVAQSGGAAISVGSGRVVMTVDFSNSAEVNSVGATSAAGHFNNATSYATMNASGLVTFNGDMSNDVASSVTAAMENVDTLTYNNGGEGAAAWFTIDSEDYLFMQGGSEGIADDSIMKFSAGSAHAIAVQGSAVTFIFSGG